MLATRDISPKEPQKDGYAQFNNWRIVNFCLIYICLTLVSYSQSEVRLMYIIIGWCFFSHGLKNPAKLEPAGKTVRVLEPIRTGCGNGGYGYGLGVEYPRVDPCLTPDR